MTIRESVKWLAEIVKKSVMERFSGTLHVRFDNGIITKAWRRRRT